MCDQFCIIETICKFTKIFCLFNYRNSDWSIETSTWACQWNASTDKTLLVFKKYTWNLFKKISILFIPKKFFSEKVLYHKQLNQQIDPKMKENFQLLSPGKKITINTFQGLNFYTISLRIIYRKNAEIF